MAADAEPPVLRMPRYEWETMLRVLGVLAVAAQAARHRGEPVSICTDDSTVIATVTPEAAAGITTAWQTLARQVAALPPAGPKLHWLPPRTDRSV